MALQIDESRAHLQGFPAYYETEIAGWMAERSERHRSGVRHAIIVGVAGALLFVVVALLFGTLLADRNLFGGSTFEILLTLALLYCGGVYMFAIYPLRRLKGEIKSYLLTKVCGFLGLEFSLAPRDFPFETFRENSLLPAFHRKKLEDHIWGAHDDVTFGLVECVLHRRQRTGKRTTYVKIFHGLLFHFDFPKRFSGRTIVSRDSGAIGNFFSRFGRPERVRLEDPRFESMFEVYGTDQVEARYLLTPTFMERVMELARSVGEKGVELAFVEDKLLITVRVAKDQFEGGTMFASVNDPGRVEQLVSELCTVFDIIDALQLNLRTRI